MNKIKSIIFIFFILFIIILFFGISYDIDYLLLLPLLISLGISLKVNANFIDKLAVFMVSMLINLIALFLIVNTVKTFIDKTPELSNQSIYIIKYMQNNQIIVENNNKLRIIDDEKLFNECLNIKCKFIIIDTYIYRPVNKKLAKNIVNEKLDILNIK